MRPIGSRDGVKPLAVCGREGGREGGSGGAVSEWKRRAWKLGGEIKRQVDSRENCLEYWLAHFLLLFLLYNTYRLLPWPHPHKG